MLLLLTRRRPWFSFFLLSRRLLISHHPKVSTSTRFQFDAPICLARYGCGHFSSKTNKITPLMCTWSFTNTFNRNRYLPLKTVILRTQNKLTVVGHSNLICFPNNTYSWQLQRFEFPENNRSKFSAKDYRFFLVTFYREQLCQCATVNLL